jgi:hypothetical protein
MLPQYSALLGESINIHEKYGVIKNFWSPICRMADVISMREICVLVVSILKD